MNRNIIDVKADIKELKDQIRSLIGAGQLEKRELTEEENEQIKELREKIDEKKEELAEKEKELEDEKNKEEIKPEKEEEKSKRNKSNHNIMNNTFKIVDVIRAKVDNTEMSEATRNAINNVTKEMRNQGLDVNGVAIPFELREATDLQGPITGNELNATISDTQGKVTIHKDYQNILAPVFNANVLNEFDTLVGLKGNVEIPRYSGVGAGWKGELKKADETTMAMNAIQASPKRLTSYIVLSKQLLMQSDYNVEAFVREQLVGAITRTLQKTVLGDEAASEVKPAGLFYGAESLEGAIDFATLVDIEKEAEEANVNSNLGYVINPGIKASLRTTLKSNVAGSQYLYENNEVLGQHTVVTNDAKGILYGDLKSIVLCSWGSGVDMVVDPYTLADYDAIKITVNSYWDIVNRAPLTGEGVSGATAVKTIYAYKEAAAVSGVSGAVSGAVSGVSGSQG